MKADPPTSQQQHPSIVKILAISDSHSLQDGYQIEQFPQADIFVHAGDFTMRNEPQQISEFRSFLQLLPYQNKVVIPGNHEKAFYEPPIKEWELTEVENQRQWLKSDCNFCEVECLELMGLKIMTVPKGPEYFDWNFDFIPEQGKKLMQAQQPKVDVLITHYPPYGILDEAYPKDHTGSKGLLNLVNIIKPKIHIFGHIHQSYGHYTHNGIDFYNVSSCNDEYQLVNEPVLIEVKRG